MPAMCYPAVARRYAVRQKYEFALAEPLLRMTEIATTVLEAMKLAPRYLAAVAVVCGVLVFASPTALDALGLREFTENHRHWIGLAFLASTAVALVDGAKEVARWVRNRVAVTKLKKARLARLHSLTEEEKQILRYYFAKQTRTNSLRIQDGIVQGLVAAGIIHQSASLGTFHSGFSYNISEFAWEYLNKNPAILEGVTMTYRTDKQEWQ